MKQELTCQQRQWGPACACPLLEPSLGFEEWQVQPHEEACDAHTARLPLIQCGRGWYDVTHSANLPHCANRKRNKPTWTCNWVMLRQIAYGGLVVWLMLGGKGAGGQKCCKSAVWISRSFLHAAMSYWAGAMKSSCHLSSWPDLKRGHAPAALAASGSMSTT